MMIDDSSLMTMLQTNADVHHKCFCQQQEGRHGDSGRWVAAHQRMSSMKVTSLSLKNLRMATWRTLDRDLSGSGWIS